MKKIKLLGWALMALTSFSACTNDAEEILAQENEIKLTSEITPSRVTSLDYQSTQIVEGQQIGVTITGAKSEHKNVAWNVGEEGELSNTGDPVYYGDGAATITAYHPFNDDWDENTSYAFSVSTNQSVDANYLNSDLLWATETSSKTESAIPLVFKHKLAKINVTLTSEDIADLSNATISICGTNITTNFNPADGTLSAATANVAEIKAGVTTTSAYTSSAIVIPQTVVGGTKFIKVEYNGKTFYYTLTADKELKSGYSHNYTLTVKEQKLEVKAESDIIDWVDENNMGDAEEVVETLLLPDGSSFNYIVGNFLEGNTNLTKIKFVANSKTKSESILVTDEDGTKGYMVANGEWLEIHTSASQFITPQNCEAMFMGNNRSFSPFNEITNIDFGENIDTSNARWMGWMFSYCKSLTSLNLKCFKTFNVIDMSLMFSYCESLTSLDLSNFNTSNVTSMSAMFAGCFSLSSLNISNFNTLKVQNMFYMFNGCLKLSSLDVSSFDTSNVTSMCGMFVDCQALTSLDLTKFKTSNVTDMMAMFYSCKSLISLDLKNFNTSKVTDMNQMFADCNNLVSLDVSSFNTSNVTDMGFMFCECTKLKSLDLSNFSFDQTPSVTNLLCEVGKNAKDQPIPIKISENGHIYLTETTTECGIESYAKFVKPDGTDW